MTARYHLVITGQPVPKARARVVRTKGRKVRTFTPERTVEAEERIRETARRQGLQPLEGPLVLRIRFYENDLRARDIDNLQKLVQDALNGLAWGDDSQIRRAIVDREIDWDYPRTEVEIEQLAIAWPPARPKKPRRTARRQEAA